MNWQSPIRSKSNFSRNQKPQRRSKTFFSSAGTATTHQKQLVLKTIQKTKQQSATDSFTISKFINMESKTLDSKLNSFIKQLQQFNHSQVDQQRQKLMVSTSINRNPQSAKIDSKQRKTMKSVKQLYLSNLSQRYYVDCVQQAKKLCLELKNLINNIKCQYESILLETYKKIQKDCCSYLNQYKKSIKNDIQKELKKKYQEYAEQKIKKFTKQAQKGRQISNKDDKDELRQKVSDTAQSNVQSAPLFLSVKQKMHKFMTPPQSSQDLMDTKNGKNGVTFRQSYIKPMTKISRSKQQVDRSSSRQMKKLNEHIKKLKDSFS